MILTLTLVGMSLICLLSACVMLFSARMIKVSNETRQKESAHITQVCQTALTASQKNVAELTASAEQMVTVGLRSCREMSETLNSTISGLVSPQSQPASPPTPPKSEPQPWEMMRHPSESRELSEQRNGYAPPTGWTLDPLAIQKDLDLPGPVDEPVDQNLLYDPSPR